MALSPVARQRLLFAVICFVWGINWLAMKAAIATVPPGFLSGTRWTFAGLVLLAWCRIEGYRMRIRPSIWAMNRPAMPVNPVCS